MEFKLKQDQFDTIISHLVAHLPEEACGLIGGTGNDSKIIYPITNQSHSAVRFYMEPVEMIQAFDDMESRKLEMVASFHSHPKGPDHPSETDIQEFNYPGTYMLIASPVQDGWQLKSFWINDGKVNAVNLVVE